MSEIFEIRKKPSGFTATLAQKEAPPSKEEILHGKHKFKNRSFPIKILQSATL